MYSCWGALGLLPSRQALSTSSQEGREGAANPGPPAPPPLAPLLDPAIMEAGRLTPLPPKGAELLPAACARVSLGRPPCQGGASASQVYAKSV